MHSKQSLINDICQFVVMLENSGDFIFAPFDLTVKTFWVLRYIEGGINTSRDLLKGIYGTKPSMTKKLQFLEENGFVTKMIDSNDRRVFRYTLTKKATETLKKLQPRYEEAVVDIFDWLTETEVATMHKYLERCRKNLDTLIKEEKHKKYQQ